MKKIFVLPIFLFGILTLIGCRKTSVSSKTNTSSKTTNIIELTISKAPEGYIKLNEDIDANQYTVNLKANGEEHKDLPITDSKLNVSGLVNGKLNTSSVGRKTITISYGTKTLTIIYNVVNFIVNNYEELKEAISQEGEIIVLMNNISVDNTKTGITISKDTKKTLELNGHTISFKPDLSSTTELIKNNGTLTIQDRTDISKNGGGTGLITNKALNPDDDWSDEDPNHPFPSYANNTITNSGELIIESGLIENTTSGGAAYAIDNNSGNNHAIVNVKGGKVLATDNFALRMYANSTTYNNIVNVTGGILEGARAIWLHLPGSSGAEKLAEINISGGTLKSSDEEYNLAIYSYTFGDSFAKTKITITGGNFEGDVAFTGGTKKTPTETVIISGGHFKGNYGAYSYGEMGPFITGGTFKANPNDYVNLETHQISTVNDEYVVTAK